MVSRWSQHQNSSSKANSFGTHLFYIQPFSIDRVCVREFLNEAELETLSDLVTSGAISYDQLADAASLHLPSGHETRRWLDDRKGL